MAPSILKKRKIDDVSHSKPPKKARKQEYHSSPSSSSADEADGDNFPAVNLADSESEADADTTTKKPTIKSTPSHPSLKDTVSSSADSDSDSDQTSASNLDTSHSTTHHKDKRRSKRNDPASFATSIHSILNAKLPSSRRPDPVLSHSRTAATASSSIAAARLDAQARHKLHLEKKSALEKGRVRDVLLGTDAGENVDAGAWVEEEKRLRKTAQRGVVKLFNAVRGAQVRGEEARREGGTGRRKEEKVGEMSKKGFLELVAGGGAKGTKGMDGKGIEEA